MIQSLYDQEISCGDNKTETSKVSQCLLQLKKQEFENLQMKFRNAHACAKHHKSFRDYELLCSSLK
jgi:hypothetical protein